jgi:HK97 family phage portal protein
MRRKPKWQSGPAGLPRRGIESRQQTPMQQYLAARQAGRPVSSAVAITDATAVKISAVFAAVRILSGLASTLPADVYERKGPGLKDAKVSSHPVSEILTAQPNSYQVPAVWEEQRQAHLSMWGNAYSELIFDRSGNLTAAVNHHPYNVIPGWNNSQTAYDGLPRLRYEVTDCNGVRTLDASRILHVPGFGFDGLEGLSTIAVAGDSLGVAASADRLVAQFANNAAKPFLVVTVPQFLDDAQFNRLGREIREEYRGDQTYGSLLLEGGATAAPFVLPFKDAQLLESRKFQGEEIVCRWFGLPPHLAGYLDNAHFDNIEEQDRALLVFTLAPMLVRKEQELNRKGFPGGERGKYYVKYNVDALLRGQMKERYEAHRNAIQSGWKTVNEVRALEDLPPLPGGDELPKPAAIWGKPDGTPPPAQAKDPKQQRDNPPPLENRSADPRLQALTLDVLSGLQQAERIHAERAAKHPDAAQRIREWYEGHELKALDKLKGLQPEARAVLTHYREHRDQLLKAITDPDPARAVEACLAGWSADPVRLTGALTKRNAA